jgi:hypothetical protein
MRIRRNIIAPFILSVGAVGSLVSIPAVSALTAVTPTTSAVIAGSFTSDVYGCCNILGEPHVVDSRASAAGFWQCQGTAEKLT